MTIYKQKTGLIGKGINGKYYCPGIDKDDTTGYRTVIETDYLQLILNGGLVFLILLLLILIPAIILGIFYSKNMLSKAAAIWILLWICYLYPARVTTFSLHYILVWISVGFVIQNQYEIVRTNLLRNHIFKIITSHNNSLPRVLIIGQTFNKKSGGGITQSNLFSGWDKDKIAVTCTAHLLQDSETEICDNYYQLGNLENKWIFPFNYFQRNFYSGKLIFRESDEQAAVPAVERILLDQKWLINYFIHF